MGGVRGRDLNWERWSREDRERELQFGPSGEVAGRQHEDTERSRGEKQMQKSLENRAAKRSICRRRLEQGREASGSPREGGGTMGAWPVKDSSGGPRAVHCSL